MSSRLSWTKGSNAASFPFMAFSAGSKSQFMWFQKESLSFSILKHRRDRPQGTGFSSLCLHHMFWWPLANASEMTKPDQCGRPTSMKSWFTDGHTTKCYPRRQESMAGKQLLLTDLGSAAGLQGRLGHCLWFDFWEYTGEWGRQVSHTHWHSQPCGWKLATKKKKLGFLKHLLP